jgi:pyruvate,water dikinase
VVPSEASDAALSGVGVSPGVVEGPARVVTDPSFDEVEPGEVLVAPSTDPSWASIMFLSSALVVDIGGALSHAAIVARELGVPCVVNTVTGTRSIRTGDHIRVDGGTGVVTILKRARQTPLDSIEKGHQR